MLAGQLNTHRQPPGHACPEQAGKAPRRYMHSGRSTPAAVVAAHDSLFCTILRPKTGLRCAPRGNLLYVKVGRRRVITRQRLHQFLGLAS